MSTKVNVNVRIDKDVKENASQIAKDMGTNLSTIMNMYLLKFTREKRIDISLNDDVITSFDSKEAEKIESLDNFNSFMDSVSWK